MHLLTAFLLIIFSSISIFLGVSRALECALNNKDPSKVAFTITVDQSGHGNFKKIQDAIDSIPSGNAQWIQVLVRQGVYTEKVTITHDKQCIALEGEGATVTFIKWGDHEATDSSATFSSSADNFVARGITFQNFYNRAVVKPDYKEQAQADAVGEPLAQALAIRVYGDKSAFHACGFLGLQDTLWDVQNRHYFNSCYIEGAVDFVFGDGQSFYEECRINATAGLIPPQGSTGYVIAQGRNLSKDPSGFVFQSCTIVGNGEVYLGRAYGPSSRVILVDSAINMMVAPAGWDIWKQTGHENDITYAEVNCHGPGSDTSKRVPWLKNPNGLELGAFTRSAFIDQEGWIGKQP